MALQTPRQRGLQRPSFGANISPGLSASTSATATRKASLQALTGQMDSISPSAQHVDSDLSVGDAVIVPGDMYGEVKFIGGVRGKSGTFVGVELSSEFAARGKNNGDVDGVSYFRTAIPGAGIFLPIHRAERRGSPRSSKTLPPTPGTPTGSATTNGHHVSPKHKFAQSVGPGARPSSPTFKPSRTSLPRPESPFRKQPPTLAPTPARPLSASQRGPRPGQTPSKNNLRASTNTRPLPSQTPRPYSRSGSRLGSRGEDGIPEDDYASTGRGVPSFSQPLRSSSRIGSSGGADQEIQRLRAQLFERDQRLEEQAATLADMENSVKELSNIIPQDLETASVMDRSSLGEHEDASAAQLRQIVREKNEKISMLTAEFDAHRADFRSTLDSLEMASTETERVYEEQKRDLLARVADLEDLTQSKEDYEGVARQLKMLEELVADLEEGLEESRRGEAEARGEVEFLRGEVERSRSELRRERDKGGSSTIRGSMNGGSSSSKELEQKDDEIRGLKAIIHGLSSNSEHGGPVLENGFSKPYADAQRLQQALDESQREREILEHELEQLRRDAANGHSVAPLASHNHTRTLSERTATGGIESNGKDAARARAGTLKPSFADRMRSHRNEEAAIVPGLHGGSLFCEMCEATDHDTLDCSKIHSERDESDAASTSVPLPLQHRSSATPISPGGRGKENEIGGTTTKGGLLAAAEDDKDKWCALCEKMGHLAFDCPEDQY